MKLPVFPAFAPIGLEFLDDLYPRLNLTADGVSEFTFSNLYLFRRRYSYQVSAIPNRTIVISGERDGKKFFMTPCGVPDPKDLEALYATHDYWKNIPESLLASSRCALERSGIRAQEDRDNFDYLYLRSDLAELAGKKFHKKRNLVNQFVAAYQFKEHKLSRDRVADAMAVLEAWCAEKGIEGDYHAAKEALELFDRVGMKGSIYYVDDKPVGWCLGETLAKGRMFAVHFEKAIEGYKGVYQFINQAFAASLPRTVQYINREQDLGDEGLRQAKLTYRPASFVHKYLARKDAQSCLEEPCGADEEFCDDGRTGTS